MLKTFSEHLRRTWYKSNDCFSNLLDSHENASRNTKKKNSSFEQHRRPRCLHATQQVPYRKRPYTTSSTHRNRGRSNLSNHFRNTVVKSGRGLGRQSVRPHHVGGAQLVWRPREEIVPHAGRSEMGHTSLRQEGPAGHCILRTYVYVRVNSEA